MRLAISNIAWDVSEDAAIASLLNKHGITAIDIAPGKYFPNPINTSNEDIAKVKIWWNEHGIEITGMQALLFGTKGLNIFGTTAIQEAMLTHLNAVCRIGAGLGATRLVFGSPKNRDRTGFDDQQTMNIAIPFFKRLGEIAATHNVIICLEPNPPCYGANFMTTSIETAKVVASVAHPAIKMQLDTGALTINNENAVAILAEYAPLIGHIHLSEPNLVPLGDVGTDHKTIFKALQQYLPEYVASIEMLATANEPHVIAIERALLFAINNYSIAIGVN